MEQVLLVVQVIIAIGLIGLVLIQRSDSDGFGLGGGSGNNLLSGRASANLLTRTTAIFAALFIINSLALGVLAARGHKPSIIETIEEQQSDEPTVPVPGATKDAEKPAEKKAAPSVPVEGEAPAKPAKKKPATTEPQTDEAE
jgi:preprotein translocase subunit SecG